MAFRFNITNYEGVVLLESDLFNDSRGYLSEIYKKSVFEENGLNSTFSQELLSLSHRGVVRGLHYQLMPQPQVKLVRVLAGCVFDVVVDLRTNSPSFGRWKSFELSESNKRQLWIPAGFAHGFQALEENTLLLYKLSSEYSPVLERGIVWNDPDLDIKWPIKDVHVSNKDSAHPKMREAEMNFHYATQEGDFP